MISRRLVSIRGVVQGVGFRPFVHELAIRFGLGGSVRNQGGSVLVEIEGDTAALDGFLAELKRRPPPLARIDHVGWSPQAAKGDRVFLIEPSQASGGEPILIPPDVATCEACLAEVDNPTDRRFAYPLVNCTHCGPRLTIITAAPYDRPRTTMAGFAMCEDCRREYENPSDRRFHAQPVACSACGPQLAAVDADGKPIGGWDPIAYAAAALAEGQIGAVKGIGGYHLVCDARRGAVVEMLRRRKARDEKPLAVMVRDVATARRICEISPEVAALLTSPARPIVLLRKRPAALAEDVAPRNPYLGVMLPYTPLHHLLLSAVGDIPLVMTSGNASDEPIAFEDTDALNRLRQLADFFITHNRPIHVRCDDSVVRFVAGAQSPVRRSRGYAPKPIPLPLRCPCPILAVGGQWKSTFALGRDRHAILSHHLGDLDHYEAYRSYMEAVGHYERLFDVEPEAIVHDLHPDYASTRYALQRGGSSRVLAVQHHHAHMASCMAEHGLTKPVIGVIFDGTGMGPDGAVWGGEFLIGDYADFQRAAHLRYVPMPGGEAAIREPWRMAAAYLWDAGIDGGLLAGIPHDSMKTARRLLDSKVNSPLTSSMGRLFDAVAAMANVRRRVTFEGQAAMELEWLATETPHCGAYPIELVNLPRDGVSSTSPPPSWQIDVRPMIRAIAENLGRGVSSATIARRFHTTVVEMIVEMSLCIREESQIGAVVLSGGVFMNALLTAETVPRLVEHGFRVDRHETVPPNDGGLCLGQLVIAAARQNGDNS